MARRRRAAGGGVRTTQPDVDQAPETRAPDQPQADGDPEVAARIAEEDAELEHFEQRARDGEDPGEDPEVAEAQDSGAAEPAAASGDGHDPYWLPDLSALSPEARERVLEIRDDARIEAELREREEDLRDLDERAAAPVEPPIADLADLFERGPLAAAIRTFEAMLSEARAGYVNAAVGELERVIDEDFTPDERQFIGTVALDQRTESDLPDVAGAYRALVRVRAVPPAAG